MRQAFGYFFLGGATAVVVTPSGVAAQDGMLVGGLLLLVLAMVLDGALLRISDAISVQTRQDREFENLYQQQESRRQQEPGSSIT